MVCVVTMAAAVLTVGIIVPLRARRIAATGSILPAGKAKWNK
jgi:hypothetical protein